MVPFRSVQIKLRIWISDSTVARISGRRDGNQMPHPTLTSSDVSNQFWAIYENGATFRHSQHYSRARDSEAQTATALYNNSLKAYSITLRKKNGSNRSLSIGDDAFGGMKTGRANEDAK